MTLSGTYAYTLDFGGAVREAWERCQMLGESMTGWQLRSGRQSMNLLLLEWATKGINLWAIEQVVIGPLAVGGQTVYTLPGTIDVLEATISTTSPVTDERILAPMSRDQYIAMPSKLQAGRPSMFWLERVNPLPVLHLWPVPDSAATYSLIYWRMRQLQDVSAGNQTIDIPPIFLDALCQSLAARLAAKWVKDASLRAELRSLADKSFAEAFSQDTERVPLSLQPDMTGWGF